ncbi:MAG: LytTR family DNA-binding domain-containing protein [Paludibacter sp.]|nr:LytTR family DNA-binding domain-containing protein [Paludibacter sp.]
MVARTKIREYLDREHPHLLTEKYGWLYLTAAALFTALSINHQQPHGLHDWNHSYKYSILACFSFIPMGIYILIHKLFPLIFPQYFNKSNWTIQKDITLLTIFFTIAGVINWGYALMKIPYYRATLSSFIHFQYYTIDYGVPPFFVIFLAARRKQAHKERKAIGELLASLLLQAPPPLSTKLPLSYNKLNVDLNNVTYINKYVNSVQFHLYREDGCEIMECIGTIKELMLQLKEYPQLVQSHQSFVVNTAWVKGLTGNSNGMEITLKNCTDKVPVSRKFVEQMKKALLSE